MTGKSKMLKDKDKSITPAKGSQRGDIEEQTASNDSVSDVSISAMYLKK